MRLHKGYFIVIRKYEFDMKQPKMFVIMKKEERLRIDRFLKMRFPYLSLVQIYVWFRKKKVRLNGHSLKDYKVVLKSGDQIEIFMSDEQLDYLRMQRDTKKKIHMNFEVLMDEDDFVIINKPTGIIVSDAEKKKESTINDAIGSFLGLSDAEFIPRAIHRLDKDTGGCLIIVKTQKGYDHFFNLFKERKIEKQYLAICHGVPKEKQGSIRVPIEKIDLGRFKARIVNEGEGREAITNYRVVKEFDKYAVLELNIETGRTHQIRIHLTHIGHPVCLDHQYGDREKDKGFRKLTGLNKQCLFAWKLAFLHPATREVIEVVADIPGKMAKWLNG